MFFSRTVSIRLLLFLIVFVGCVSSSLVAAAEPVRVAIVPYINSSGETRSVVDATISSKLEAYFQSGKYAMVPQGEVADFLAKNGYDSSQMLLPEKDVLLALASATDADAVLALDFTRIQASRRYSWFYAYTIGSVSIYAKALSVADNNSVSLRVEKQEKLRASRFGPGVKERTAIGAGIEAAMDELFAKLPF